MRALTAVLCVALPLCLLTAAGIAAAKGGSGKVSGWSGGTTAGTSRSSRAPGTGKNGTGVAGISMQGPTASGNPGMGMSGMMMTPNGMIMQNTPPLTVYHSTNTGGSSMVTAMAPSVGNSQLAATSRGIGNSQGGGGTLDIAAMTHFGMSGVAAIGALVGLEGANIGSLISSGPAGLAKPISPASGGKGSTIKSQLMGMPTNKSCVSTAGGKASCG